MEKWGTAARDVVALDLETTGLDSKTERILEIGAVRIRDGREEASFSRLVNPGREIPDAVRELTGITGEMTAACPPVEEVLPEFLEFCGELPILGHNVLFDYRFLKRAAVNQGFSFERRGFDTLALCRKFMPEGEKKNLAAACRYYGVETGTSHRALGRRPGGPVSLQAARSALRGGKTGGICPQPPDLQSEKGPAGLKKAKRSIAGFAEIS